MSQVKVGTVSIDTGSAKVQRKVWNNPLEAIRAKCIDCSGGSTHEVRICSVFDCPQWRCRMGVRPNTLAKTRPELLDPDAVAIAAGQQFYVEARGILASRNCPKRTVWGWCPTSRLGRHQRSTSHRFYAVQGEREDGSGRTSGVKALGTVGMLRSITSPTQPSAPLTDEKSPNLAGVAVSIQYRVRSWAIPTTADSLVDAAPIEEAAPRSPGLLLQVTLCGIRRRTCCTLSVNGTAVLSIDRTTSNRVLKSKRGLCASRGLATATDEIAKQ